MKFLILLSVFLSVIFAEETIETKEKTGQDDTEIDHSGETEIEGDLEFQSQDITSEYGLGWIDPKYF